MPARRAPSRPGCESSTTRQSRGARSGSRTRSRSSARRKPSGEGLPTLPSSALTIAAKQSARPACARISSISCRSAPEATARVPLAVASGALRHEIELILAQAGLADCFAAIVSAEDGSVGKPSPEGFLRALDRLRVRLPDLAPRDCLVVEDSQPGLEGARRAGMRCLAVTNSYPAAELGGADLIVRSLAEAGWDRLAALF